MCDKSIFYYSTIQMVNVQNWKYGLIFRSIQALIACYVILYMVVYSRGYQAQSSVSGTLFTKVKGGILLNDTDATFYNANDVTIPAVENNALFVTTHTVRTMQTRGVCVDPEVRCTSNADCPAGRLDDTGQQTGICDTTAGFCTTRGWCPQENEDIPIIYYMGVENLTVLIRSNAVYEEFDPPVAVDNADRIAMRYNIFPIHLMLGEHSIEDVRRTGCIISVTIDWTCNLDNHPCPPALTFSRTDNKGASTGFNFRRVTYSTVNNTEARELVKYYGIRFIFQTTGTGSRFDLLALSVCIGSGIAYLSIATLIVDVVLGFLDPKNDSGNPLNDKKFIPFKVTSATERV